MAEDVILNGRYVLTDERRPGGMSVVIKGFDRTAGQIVAVKMLRTDGDQTYLREAFSREFDALKDLEHPNIVKLLDVGRTPDGQPFLVLEWIERNLEQWIESRGRYAWGELYDRIGQPILNALVFAQSRNRAHRDIKPRNILVTATEALVPMSRARKWLLVGDPKQLPPFFEEFKQKDIASDDYGADPAEMRQTILDRLLAFLPEQCREGLTEQHRMVEPIGNLISQCFYKNKIVSPVKAGYRAFGAKIPKPVTWIDTSHAKDRGETPVGKSFQNMREATIIRDVLVDLNKLATRHQQNWQIAIIAGYAAQVNLLSSVLRKSQREWKALEIAINTVDAFQGRQADICVYSVTRSNPRGDLGFLYERPRLNVALSRGKIGLIILGDRRYCQNAKGENPFRAVIDYIEHHPNDCAVRMHER